MCAESLIVSASATGGVTAASFSDTDTIKVGSGSGFGGEVEVVGRGWVLMMTQRQLLNQPSLSMLISSIFFLMNWLACERTGGNYSNWGEWQEQGRGWGRGVPQVSRMDERCVCVCLRECALVCACDIRVCVCVCGRAGRVSKSFLVTIEQSAGPVETRCGSFHVVLSNTSNCAVKPLFSALLRKVCQLAESGRGAREGERRKQIQSEALSWRSN